MKHFFTLNLLVFFTSFAAHSFPITADFLKCYEDNIKPVFARVEECNKTSSITLTYCGYGYYVTNFLSGNEYVSILNVTYQEGRIPTGGTIGTPLSLVETISCRGSEEEIKNSTSQFKTTIQTQYKPSMCPNTIRYGSVIDYSKGTVSENIPIAGTDFELFYSSEYNRNLPMNNTIEETFYRSQGSTVPTRLRLTAGGQKIEDIPLITTLNFKKIASDTLALQEETAFIKRYQYNYSIEEYYPNISGGCTTTFYRDPVTGELRWYACVDMNEEDRWFPVTSGVFKPKVLYKPEVWGLNGWTVSTHHYLDRGSNTVFTGFGMPITYKGLTPVKLAPYGDVLLAIDQNGGNEFYVFGLDGRHLETRDTIWNKPIRKFSYSADNRLIKITDRFGLETVFNYDSQNQLVSIRAPYGQATQFVIENNKITNITNPLLNFNSMTYGGNSELLTFKALNDEITNFNYDSEGRLLNETKSSGLFQGIRVLIEGVVKTAQFYYRNYLSGYKTTELPTASESNYENISYVDKYYDSESRLVSKTNSFINELKQVTYLSDQNITTTMEFDPFWGRDLVSTVSTERKILALGESFLEKAKTQTYRDYLNFEDFEKNGGGRDSYTIGDQYVEINYNKAEKRVTYVDSLGGNRNIIVNEFGQPLEITEGNLPIKYFEYDTFHRLSKTTVGDFSENYSYDQFGYLSNITNSKNQSTTLINNALGLVREQILPNQDRILFEYTAGGSISKITAPNGQVHYYQMSIGDYVTNYFTPNNKNTIFEYDEDKRLKKLTKPSGGEIVYNYKTNSSDIANIELPSGVRQFSEIDEQGRIKRLTSEDQISLEVSWAGNSVKEQKWYDDDGSLLATLTFGYRNNMLRINSVSLNGEEFANYGAGDIIKGGVINSRIDCTTSPEESVCWSASDDFTTRYKLQKSEDNTKVTKSATVSLNRVAVEGILLARNINLVREFSMNGNAFSVSSEDIRYDSTGEHKTVVSIVPEYDVNNRIMSAIKTKNSTLNGTEIESSTVNSSYSLPSFSNNNVKEYVHNQRRTVASHNSDDQLITLTGSINRSYEYNEDGDLKSMTNCYGKIEYDYDVFGNLKKVTFPGNKVVEYKVDGLNRRVKKLVNGAVSEYYIWYDGLRLAAVLDANKQVKLKYIYAPDSRVASFVVKDGVMYRIVHDPGIESVRYVFNMQTKEVVQELDYDEHGNITKNTNPDLQSLGYAGGLYDRDTKLIRFGARDYDPTIGRWTTKDPIGFAGGDTNLYAYVGGDPMSKIDPSGLFGLFGSFSLQGSTFGASINGFLSAYLGEDANGAGIGGAVGGGATNLSIGLSGGKGFSGGFYANTMESFLNADSFDINSPLGGLSFYYDKSGNFEGFAVGGPSLGVSLSFTESQNSKSLNKGLSFIKNRSPSCKQ